MIFLLSPAKKLDEVTPSPVKSQTVPALLKKTERLIAVAQQLSPPEIESLMQVSEKIALTTASRFSSFALPFDNRNAKPAVFLFNGDAYEGLAAYHRTMHEIHYLHNRLIILSGLYGAIQALDLIQPYRLEMGTRLKTPSGTTLYDFWKNDITHYINMQLTRQKACHVINLASQEYFKAVHPEQLNAKVITPIFKELRNGQYKTISFHAKRARGLMMQYACTHELTDPQMLKSFALEGYYFHGENPGHPDEWLFYRNE